MKKLIAYAVLALVSAAPALSFAQSTSPVTRAQVKAQLVQLEKAGYNPFSSDINYPADIQAAEKKVAMLQAESEASTAMHSVGGVQMTGRSASRTRSMQGCVGPVDFCTPYFGA